MQSHPHDASRSYSYQHYHQTSPSSPHLPNYVDNDGQPVRPHPVALGTQVQMPTYVHPQDFNESATIAAGSPTDLLYIPITQQSGSSLDTQYVPQHYVSNSYMGPLLNSAILSGFQNYHPTELERPIIPSHPHADLIHSRNPYPIPAIQTEDGHAQYSNPGDGASPIVYEYSAPPTSSPSSPHACDVCGATFTRSHNRKRHYESRHSMVGHVCMYCGKSYTRVDSLKRHLDRPCDQMPQSTPNDD